MAIDVPFLPDDAIAERAIWLLHEAVPDLTAPPVPVDEIVEFHLGLRLEVSDLKSVLGMDDVLGATWIDQKLVRIDQSIEEQEGRFSFTVAHEVGHWILHREAILASRSMLSLFDDLENKTPSYVCRGKDKRERIEIQADRFAAELLMPRPLMVEVFRKLFPDGASIPEDLIRGDEQAKEWWLREIASTMIEEGGFTNCSKEAMKIRLTKLGFVNLEGGRMLF